MKRKCDICKQEIIGNGKTVPLHYGTKIAHSNCWVDYYAKWEKRLFQAILFCIIVIPSWIMVAYSIFECGIFPLYFPIIGILAPLIAYGFIWKCENW